MKTAVGRRIVSPALFALIGLSFLLPFATVSCNDARTSFTGIQLVAHTVPRGGTVEDEGKRFELSDRVENDASVQATVALMAAVAGVLLGLLGSRGSGVCSVVGLAATLLIPVSAFATLVTVSFHVGFFLMLALYLLLVFLHAVVALTRRRSRRAPPVTQDETAGQRAHTGGAGP